MAKRRAGLAVLLVSLAIHQTGISAQTGGRETAGTLESNGEPYLLVLGIAQDGGVPQTGDISNQAWRDPAKRRRVACLAVVDPKSGQRWMIDATPDIKEQLHTLDLAAPTQRRPGLDGIFLTHAHIGHYLGLALLGHESMGARDVPVYAMPKMVSFLRHNGPWDQLVRYHNITLSELAAGEPVKLNDRLTITPIPVPHRQEYSEVVGYRVEGPRRSALYIPDIDSWETWDGQGAKIEDQIAKVDIAFLDGSFYANGEIPGRDMSGFPHPFVTHSMERLSTLPESERGKVRFIHLNHTNPVLDPDSMESKRVVAAGFHVAVEGNRLGL